MERIYLRDIDDNQIEVEFIRYFHFKNTNYLIYTKNEQDEKGYIKLYPVKVMESLGEKIARSIKDETEWDNMQLVVKTVIKEIKDEKIESFIDLDEKEIINLKIVDSRFFKLDPKLVELLGSNIMLGIDRSVTLSDYEENLYQENLNETLNENVITINDQADNVDLFLGDINNVVSEEDKISNDTQVIGNSETLNLTKVVENVIEDTSNVWQDKNIDDLNVETQVQKELVENDNDYKTMYEAVLKEKDELSDILTNMVIELTNYKVKYGDLKEE